MMIKNNNTLIIILVVVLFLLTACGARMVSYKPVTFNPNNTISDKTVIYQVLQKRILALGYWLTQEDTNIQSGLIKFQAHILHNPSPLPIVSPIQLQKSYFTIQVNPDLSVTVRAMGTLVIGNTIHKNLKSEMDNLIQELDAALTEAKFNYKINVN